jgi:hypothetical protein
VILPSPLAGEGKAGGALIRAWVADWREKLRLRISVKKRAIQVQFRAKSRRFPLIFVPFFHFFSLGLRLRNLYFRTARPLGPAGSHA